LSFHATPVNEAMVAQRRALQEQSGTVRLRR
jgi:hypothetical protein